MPERNLMIAVSFWRAIIRLASYIDTAVAILKAIDSLIQVDHTDTKAPYLTQLILYARKYLKFNDIDRFFKEQK